MRKVLSVLAVAIMLTACSTTDQVDDKGWVSQGRWTYIKEVQTSVGTCVLITNSWSVAITCEERP